MFKFKRKLKFRGQVYFESVYPDCLYMGLSYLKENICLYNSITIDMIGLPIFLMNLADEKITNAKDFSDSSDGNGAPCSDTSVIPKKVYLFHILPYLQKSALHLVRERSPTHC